MDYRAVRRNLDLRENGGNYTTKIFIICDLLLNYHGDEINLYEMGEHVARTGN
jgi:hypothetical protein